MANEARPIKRKRATKAEMAERRAVVLDIVRQAAPTSVRHAYYAAITRGLVYKDTAETKRRYYGRIQREILNARRDGDLPYSDIVDSTRWMRKPTSYPDIDAAVEHWFRSYRRDMWASGNILLEVWCESESIAGVLEPVTSTWDVPLLPCKGYSSETFAWNAADNYLKDGRRPVVLYVGDLDLHGKRIEDSLRHKLEGHYGEGIEWTRVGLTEEQVEEHNLGGMATREGHWEAEALPPDIMRDALEAEIRRFVDENQLRAHEAAEESERRGLLNFRRVMEGQPISEN